MANLPTDLSNKANGAEFRNKSNLDTPFEKMAHSAGERVGTMASDLASATAESMNSGRDYVKGNPVKGVAIAAAVGLVTGSLLTMVLRGRKN